MDNIWKEATSNYGTAALFSTVTDYQQKNILYENCILLLKDIIQNNVYMVPKIR